MSFAINTFPDVQSLAYASARNLIQSGDILLCSGSALFSKLIQQATSSVWSHVAFIIRLEQINRIMVLESVETIGVRTVPLSSYAANYNGTGKGYPGRILIARHSAFKQANIGALSKHAVDLLGYPYDNTEILKIAARIGLRSLDLDQQQPDYETGRSFICSEYAFDCYRSVGINIEYDPAGFIAPADFARVPEIKAITFIDTATNS